MFFFSYGVNRSSNLLFPRPSLVVLQSSDGFCFHSVLIMLNEIPDIRLNCHRNQNHGQTNGHARKHTLNPIMHAEIYRGIRIGRFELSSYQHWPHLSFQLILMSAVSFRDCLVKLYHIFSGKPVEALCVKLQRLRPLYKI